MITHNQPFAPIAINPLLIAGVLCVGLTLAASLALFVPFAPAEFAERTAFLLLAVALIQSGYMALKPSLPWLVVVGWAVIQFHILLLSFERSSGAIAFVLFCAMFIQGGISIALGVAGCGKMLQLRRLKGPL